MKKIKKTVLGFLFAMFFVSPSFGGTTNVGFAVDLTSIDASGDETLAGNSTSSTKSHSHDVAIPSLFIEREGDNGVRVGIDYIPIEGAMGEESRADDDFGASGSTSVTSTFGGNYEIIVPEGAYSVYSHVLADGQQNLVSLRNLGIVNGNQENVNLSANIGYDAWIILYEEHMGEIINLEGLVELSTAQGEIDVWATDPFSKFSLPGGEYQIDLNKFGYELEKIYYGPEEEKEETGN